MHLPSWLKALEHLAPVVLTLTPLAPISPLVAAAMNVAEQIPGATGQQKKEYVQQIVSAGVTALNSLNGKIVIDPNSVAQVSSGAIDTIVGVNNIIHGREADSTVGEKK